MTADRRAGAIRLPGERPDKAGKEERMDDKKERTGITPAALTAFLAGDLRNAIIAATPGGIEAQETAGQAALVCSSDMPKEMHPSRQAYESLGFVFGEPVDGIFLAAKLPAGWTRKATDHAMWSDVLDERGRKRVSIFYKAAFYDRRAHASLEKRFAIRRQYHGLPDGDGLAEEIRSAVFDGDKELWRSGAVSRKDYKAADAAAKEAEAWLLERYPDVYNPLAYWNEP